MAGPRDILQQMNEEKRKKLSEQEDRQWKEVTAKFHREAIGFFQWDCIDGRTPEDPIPEAVTQKTRLSSGDGRIMLHDGLYRRTPPFKVKHWWRPDEEYPIEIRIKDGYMWPTPVGLTALKSVNLAALNEANAAVQEMARMNGAEGVLIAVGPPDRPGYPPHHVIMQYGFQLAEKELELEALIKNAEDKGLAIKLDDSTKRFLDDYANRLGNDSVLTKLGDAIGTAKLSKAFCESRFAKFLGLSAQSLEKLKANPGELKGSGVEKRRWFYNMEIQLAVNPEGGLRARQFDIASSNLKDEMMVGKVIKESVDKEMEKFLKNNPHAKESDKIEKREKLFDEASKMYTNDSSKLQKAYLDKLYGATPPDADKKLEILTKELERIEQQFNKFDAQRERIDESLDKFLTAAKADYVEHINWAKIEGKLEESRAARDSLVSNLKNANKDVLATKDFLVAEIEKLQKDLEAQKEKKEKELPTADKEAKAKLNQDIKTIDDSLKKMDAAKEKVAGLKTQVEEQQKKLQGTEERNRDFVTNIQNIKNVQQQNTQRPRGP